MLNDDDVLPPPVELPTPRRSRNTSRKSSVVATEPAPIEEAIVVERRQSSIPSATPAPQTTRPAPPNANVNEVEMVGTPPHSAASLKSRTFSMEMHDAIDALHRRTDEGSFSTFYIISDDRVRGTDLIAVEQDSTGASEQDVSLVVDEKEGDATHDLASDTDTADSHSSASGSHSSHSSPTPDPSTQATPPRAQSTIRMTSNTAAHALPAPTAPPPRHREDPLDPWTVYYDCAAGCLEPVKIRQGEPLVCRNCGYRILYKRRTSRICYFEAR